MISIIIITICHCGDTTIECERCLIWFHPHCQRNFIDLKNWHFCNELKVLITNTITYIDFIKLYDNLDDYTVKELNLYVKQNKLD